MAETLERYRTSKEIKKEMADLNLELAFQTKFEKEMERLIADCEVPDLAIEKMVQESDARVLKRINRCLGNERMMHLTCRIIPKAGKLVAGLMLVFFIGLTTAVATIQSVRIDVLNFIIKIEERCSKLYLEESGIEVELPQEWKGVYYMTYIPDGFKLIDWSEDEVLYADDEGHVLGFGEYAHGMTCNLDTEDAEITYDTVNGRAAMVVEKGDWVAITWSVGNRYFVLDLIGAKEDALRITESVYAIR